MFENLKKRFNVGPKNVYLGTEEVYMDQIVEPLILGNKNKFNNSDAEKVSVAVTCVKILGDTIGKLPINVYQKTDEGNQVDREDYRYDLLHYSPDGVMTAQSFISTLEYNRNLKGNSFARIHRDQLSGKAMTLEFLPNNMVIGYEKVNGRLYYKIYVKDKNNKNVEKVISSEDMLHFKMISKNGIWGINPIEVQRQNLSTAYKSKATIDSYYENNAFSPLVLKSLIPDAQFLKPFQEAMKKFKTTNVGANNAGKATMLPPFTEIQQLNLDPIDAKFIEGSKFDYSQIASFYGVPADMVGVYDYSKYNNVEQAQLNFKVNTLSAITKMYRAEFEMKLLTNKERKAGKSIEFVTQALMETDIATRTAYYKSMFDLGVMTQNQIALIEGLPTFKDGDKHYMSTQTTALEDRGTEMDQDSSTN